MARLSTLALVLAQIRIAAGIGLLALTVALGTSGNVAGAAFAAGAFALVFASLADPRRRLFAPVGDPEALPGDARLESRLELARAGVFPSTVGVAVLTGIALGVGQGTLAALLAGAIAGMGLAALLGGLETVLREREEHVELLLERRSGRRFVRPARQSTSS